MLVEGVRREGLNSAVVARELPNGVVEIIDGVHRVRAAREAGVDQVAAYVYPLGACSDAQAAAMQIGFNRLRGELDLTAVARQLATWDLVAEDLAVLAGYSDLEAQLLVDSLTPPTTDDLMGLDPTPEPAQESDGPAPVFELALRFASRAELQAVKKALRKSAGKSKDMAKGLLATLGLTD